MVQKSAYRVLALTAAVIGLTPSTAGADRAVVRNLEMTREGSRISFLLSFSDQPRAAGVETSATGLSIDVGGLELAVPAFAPPSGGIVRRVTTEPTASGGTRVRLEGAAFTGAAATIYRNAILVEARLASDQPIPSEPPESPKAPLPSLAPMDVIPASAPSAPAAIAKEAPKGAAARPPAPGQATRETASISPAALMSGSSAADCSAVRAQLTRTPWDVPSLGHHALCLIETGKLEEAGNRVSQIAAFSADDWRAHLTRAALNARQGRAEEAAAGFEKARMATRDDAIRAAIDIYVRNPLPVIVSPPKPQSETPAPTEPEAAGETSEKTE
jgi:hypothetical protein